MFPILFKIGRFELHTYGLMLALGFATGFLLAVKRGKKYGFDFDLMYSTTVVIIISSLLGSRLAYVVLHLDEFKGRYGDIINPFQSTGQIGISGMVILGGVLSGFVFTALYLRWRKINVGEMADVMAPPLALGIAFGRAGCFFNGCCFGRECHLPWGVRFPADSMPGYFYRGEPVHPTQIYEMLYALAIMFLIFRYERKAHFKGANFAVFSVLYGFFRFFNESIRFYESFESSMKLIKVMGMDITFSQIISLTMIIAGAVVLIMGNRRYRVVQG